MGCGWLGFPLAQSLSKEGYTVYGSTTSPGKLPILEKAGIVPFLIAVSEEGIKGPIVELLRNVDTLILNIPPKLRGNNRENYVKKMELVSQAVIASGIRKIVFMSSTSVYGDRQGSVTEMTPPKPTTESGRQLFASEKVFRHIPNVETTVIRFGGLIGKDRHPITMLSGKKGLQNGNHPVNLIHLNDCIAVISAVIIGHWWGEVFNAVYPLHPTKEEYYRQIAAERGLKSPEYGRNSQSPGKLIRAHKLQSVKKFNFKTTILD